MATARRAMLIGLDAAIPELVQKFVEEGELPNIAKLLARGFSAEALACMPTLTSTNWVTISTGALPGTHGIVDMGIHLPGKPLDILYDGFLSTYCQAEHLWQAAESAGKKAILIKYPCTWPPTITEGFQVMGHEFPAWGGELLQLCPPMCYSTDFYPLATQIRLKPATGWKNLPASSPPPLETIIEIVPKRRSKLARGKGGDWREGTVWEPGRARRYHLLLVDEEGKGYSKCIISPTKDANDAIAKLSEGQWSPWCWDRFLAEDSWREATFRWKLIELSPEGKHLRLYRTHVYPTSGFTFPDEIGPELVREIGPVPSPNNNEPLTTGWVDEDTFFEEWEAQPDWVVKVTAYLMQKTDWNLLFTQWHGPDHIQHLCMGEVEPTAPGYDEGKAAKAWDMIRRTYRIADKFVGDLVALADDETVIVVVSDHGQVPLMRGINLPNLLADAGLLAFIEDPETGDLMIDWSRTKVYQATSIHLFINVKGRDPQGIVEMGREYEEVQDQVIKLLYDLEDPETGVRPISLALRKEDARILGLFGDRIGDIICVTREGYYFSRWGAPIKGGEVISTARLGAGHGHLLPTTKYGVGSLGAFFVMAGPGVKKGCVSPKPIFLTDIAPTLAYLLGIPCPREADGKVIYDALEC